MVQKAAKFKKRFYKQPASTGPKTLAEASWKHVKLSGPVISDDGADLEGLIGLEVLENYDRKLVTKDKKKKVKKDSTLQDSEYESSEEQNPNRDSFDSDDSNDEPPKTKRQKKSDKQKKCNKRVAEDESDSDSDHFSKNGKPGTKSKNKSIHITDDDDDFEMEEQSTPGRFVMLKTPIDEKGSNDKKRKKRKRKEKPTIPQSSKTSCSSTEYFRWIELGVSEPIVHALADKGFRIPTEIQTLSLPVAILGKRDLLGAAETGSGKTLAFGIPVLEGIMKLKEKGTFQITSKSRDNHANQVESDDRQGHELTPPPEELEYYPEIENDVSLPVGEHTESTEGQLNKPLYALILTPTRELAVQINDHLRAVCKYTDIQIATVFGGLATVKQERMLRKCPDIVIATPGRLWELIQARNPHLCKVCDIRFLVIDETDRMLETGHFEELKQLLEMINQNKEAAKLRRNYIFSATLTLDHDLPEHLVAKSKKNKNLKIVKPTTGQRLNNLIETIGMTDPKVVDITQQHGTAQSLTESRILCKAEHKDYYLYYFLQRHPGRTLVFCNSIDCVKRLVSLFGYLNCDPLSLFGSMQQRQRLKNLEKFTHNPAALLIATDVAARGLDIPNVDHVIHYQVPKATENYVHRSGRTARASKEGITVLLIGASEVKDYVKLNQSLGRKEDLPLYPTSERMMKQVKDRVNLARDIERMDLHQRRNNESQNWEEKVAKEFQSDSDIDSEQEEERQLKKGREKRQMKARRLQLSKLLATPLMADRVELKFPTSAVAISVPAEKENSAIKLVQQVAEQNVQFKKERNKKKRNN
ncbi:ATP-dependent RNA helicase DDX24 [Toxorhynchites rutilus septentrionalis]|uniref:ATP-dependent RNA helicase DDX24 n=1 Tax=Toxorhynchites rutilus septentrionalis TaxID=329112 RepID=UPI00247A693D|nr:ATP-dependent RNA helicase DDX24 [Toxorhynchites rutilus septentrionalis]